MSTVEVKYAEPPRSPMASTPAELKIHEAIKRALSTPPKQFERIDGTQVVRENGEPVFECIRVAGGRVDIRQLREGPYDQSTVRSLRSILNMAILPAFAFQGWDGKLQGAILQILPAKRQDALGLNEIARVLRGSRPQISAALNALVESGEIQMERLKKRGAPKIFWRGK
jgi:hypothetical protein